MFFLFFYYGIDFVPLPPSAVLWTGEVWKFLTFTERHPSIFYNILLFGLTSALGQVGVRETNEWVVFSCLERNTLQKLN